MIEFYPQIRWLHITCVLASICLFSIRGVLVLCGHERLAMSAALRYLSYSIDTVLLSAALLLLTILPDAVFHHHWLGVKLGLIVVYVVLGSLALKRAGTRTTKAICFIGAIATILIVWGIARAHHPAGWWH